MDGDASAAAPDSGFNQVLPAEADLMAGVSDEGEADDLPGGGRSPPLGVAAVPHVAGGVPDESEADDPPGGGVPDEGEAEVLPGAGGAGPAAEVPVPLPGDGVLPPREGVDRGSPGRVQVHLAGDAAPQVGVSGHHGA
eukprot:2058160-Pyramimonas_sp.AAC.1